MITGPELLARSLKGYGLTHVFFVPSIVARALAEMEDLDIRRVSTHGEIAAAYMADGYARAARRPGVCFAQAIGASNAAAGLRDPFMANSPVICITGGPHPDTRYRHLYQEVEDSGQFDPVTKLNITMTKVERLPDLLRQAFRAATTGCPGPVHLAIPGRAGNSLLSEVGLELLVEERYSRYPAHRTEPEAEAVRDAARALRAAKKPVILAGGGVTSSDAGRELLSLAERLNIPVATSLNGKESIPDRHPLAVGLAGQYGRWCANELLTEADLVFWVGSRTGGQVTDDWKAPPPGTRSIQLDIDPAEIGRNYPAEVALVGDAKATLRRLLEALEGDEPTEDRASWVKHAQGLVREWRGQIEAQATSDAAPIRPERLCHEIAGYLPEDGVLVSDTGLAAQWSGTMIGLRSSSQRYIRSAGSLGWGFPGAMGVKCALPDRPVICLTGDGGFYFHLSELETAARLGIAVVVVVNNNSALKQCEASVDRAYDGVQRGRAWELWRYRDTNFARIAEDMGCLGRRVAAPQELRGALEWAVAANQPAVIDVVTDPQALPPAAWR